MSGWPTPISRSIRRESFTLRNLGSRLVKFLEAEPRWVAPHKQLALDMARLEWAHIEAFDNEATPAAQDG